MLVGRNAIPTYYVWTCQFSFTIITMAPIVVFFFLTLLSYLAVIYIRRLAVRYQILAHPNERSSHSIPMPHGGGLAIVFLVLGSSVWAADQIQWERSLLYIVLGAILALVGWRDRRGVQLIVARSNRDANLALHRELNAAVAAALV